MGLALNIVCPITSPDDKRLPYKLLSTSECRLRVDCSHQSQCPVVLVCLIVRVFA